MKISLSVKMRSFIVAATFFAGLSFATIASAVDFRSYLVDLNSKTVTEIGTLGGRDTVLNDLNDMGQVVGDSQTSAGVFHAFITGPDGVGMKDLGTPGNSYSTARSINNVGQVVGAVFGTGAFITGPDGVGMRYLDSDTQRFAYGINNSGQVVGNSNNAEHGYITGPNGMGIRDLGALPGDDISSATAINDSGQVVGGSRDEDPSSGARVFITGPNGMVLTDLGFSPGAAQVSGINNGGQVTGFFNTDADTQHAFITGPNGVGITDLGVLSGTESSYARGINEAGQVVGGSYPAGNAHNAHAFITGPNGIGMIDLNSLIDLPGGNYFADAYGINNSGQVIAVAVIPEPEIYALLLSGLALIGFLARREKIVVSQTLA